ncbi:MAG: hypothetical protein K2X27_24665, partial [Candidatus Obscuribacterales bacterium]|nr:hypothetical protein [Candidatus Obscuribacterales bacterium]
PRLFQLQNTALNAVYRRNVLNRAVLAYNDLAVFLYFDGQVEQSKAYFKKALSLSKQHWRDIKSSAADLQNKIAALEKDGHIVELDKVGNFVDAQIEN